MRAHASRRKAVRRGGAPGSGAPPSGTGPRRSRVLDYRRQLWRSGPGTGVATVQEAAAFVRRVGLCLLFGCGQIPLPKLELCGPPDFEWWEWKDRLQELRRAYLGRVVRRKATLVALDLLPAFLGLYYAGGGVEVYDEEHQRGRLSDDAWRIGEHLSRHGPTPVDQLRRTLVPPGPAGTRRFHRALDEMQEKFKTVTVGRVQKHWSVRIIGLLSDWAPPELLREAQALARDPQAARQRILGRAVRAAGVLGVREAAVMFGWEQADAEGTAARLANLDPDLVRAGASVAVRAVCYDPLLRAPRHGGATPC